MSALTGFGFVRNLERTSLEGQMAGDKSNPWVAAGDGDLPLLISSLYELRLSVNAADANGFTMCHAAAAYNRVDVLRWLLDQNGIDPNAKDSDGDTPLHHCDAIEAARILVRDGGANPMLVNEDGKTALNAKEDELKDLEQNAEDADLNDELQMMKELVQYLQILSQMGNAQEAAM